MDILFKDCTKEDYVKKYLKILFANSPVQISELEYDILVQSAVLGKFDIKHLSTVLNKSYAQISNYKRGLVSKSLLILIGTDYKVNTKIIPKDTEINIKFYAKGQSEQQEGSNI